MTVETATSAAYLAAYLEFAELVGATSSSARSVAGVSKLMEPALSPRTASKPTHSESVARGSTSASEDVLQVVNVWPDTEVLDELASYMELESGWDGEEAVKPSMNAINEAIRFARIVSVAEGLAPSLHVDGSVILELADDEGSLRFKGDGQIIYALSGIGYGVAPFDRYTVPAPIKTVFPI